MDRALAQKETRFNVYYDDVHIGVLTVNATRTRHRYEPNFEGVAAVRDRACLLKVMETGTDGFTDTIPFFENRLYNMRRWGLHTVNYQTDKFVLDEIME